jgi:hypothetical protein
MNKGIQQAIGLAVTNPLPLSWIGLSTAPSTMPAWADTKRLTPAQTKNLLAQIGYDKSSWNYSLIGTNNALGRYQFSTTTLENYGILAVGSNKHYGVECINYQRCWVSTVVTNYNYGVTSLNSFLNNRASQDHLAYQILFDIYNASVAATSIVSEDSNDVVAGMIYVGWNLGAGTRTEPTKAQATGIGAFAWRYYGLGEGSTPFNSGRYAVTILSQ